MIFLLVFRIRVLDLIDLPEGHLILTAVIVHQVCMGRDYFRAEIVTIGEVVPGKRRDALATVEGVFKLTLFFVAAV